MEDRYVGQFASGVKTGHGLSIASSGIFAETWEADILQSRAPVFENEVRSPANSNVQIQPNAQESSHRSCALAMGLWTTDEIAILLKSIGFDRALISQIVDHHMNGAVLCTLASRAASSLLKRIFKC